MIRNYSIDEETYNRLYQNKRKNRLSYAETINSLLPHLKKIKLDTIGDVIKKAKETGIHNTKKVTFTFNDETYQKLYDKATETHSSISAVIRELIKFL